jgi:hypothetical protein
MKSYKTNAAMLLSLLMTLLVAFSLMPSVAFASGGSGTSGGGGTTIKVDTIKVSKCYYAIGGQMLIKASSSDPTARLFAYTPFGTYLGEVQNGGGSRYGGTGFPFVGLDPVEVTILSTSGGSITVPTTPPLTINP